MPEMPVWVRSRTFACDQAMHRLEKQFPLSAQSVLYLVFTSFTLSFSHSILLGESNPALSNPNFLCCCTKNQQFLFAVRISATVKLLYKYITHSTLCHNNLRLSTLDSTKQPLQIHLCFISDAAISLGVCQNRAAVYSWRFVMLRLAMPHPV